MAVSEHPETTRNIENDTQGTLIAGHKKDWIQNVADFTTGVKHHVQHAGQAVQNGARAV